MSTIKKLNQLKALSVELSARIRSAAPLSTFVPSFVSRNGLTYSDLSERIERVAGCASIVELKETWSPGISGRSGAADLEQVLTVSAANYCKQHTICPVCADRSQARRRARFDEPIRRQVSEVKEKKKFAYLATYTVTDGPDLAERLEHLKESKRNFRLMGQRRKGGRSLGESGKIKAAISTIEIKRGDNSKLWHVHAHELVFTDERLNYSVYDQCTKLQLQERFGKWIPKSELEKAIVKKVPFRNELKPVSPVTEQWLQATGGDSIDLDIEPIRHVPAAARGKKRRMYRKMSFEDSVAYQAKECLKYPTKPGDLDPLDSLRVIDDTYNKRMVATYGEFRAIGGDDYTDEAEPDENTFVLVWDKDARQYGDPQPGTLRDFIDGDDTDAHDARSESGKITGEYRRRRRLILSDRSRYGNDLYSLLDEAKKQYRGQISSIWSLYRQKKSCSNRTNSGRCDKYNALIALDGAWIPGSDERTLYAAAFS